VGPCSLRRTISASSARMRNEVLGTPEGVKLRPIAYQNQANFEGLLDVANAADTRGFGHLADYCRLREKGLRARALQALDDFIAAVLAMNEADCRDAVGWVVDTILDHPEVHHLGPEPLLRRLVEPVLQQWAEEPDATRPRRLLALLRRDGSKLRAVLQSDPGDERCRGALIGLLLDEVDYSCHHLVEGLFTGSEEQAQAILDEAKQHICQLQTAEVRERADRVHAELRLLVEDWLEFRADGSGEFPQWCANRGHHHRWWSVVYFDAE
jgi:hypothetical protein